MFMIKMLVLLKINGLFKEGKEIKLKSRSGVKKKCGSINSIH